ncbi:MAG: carboxypeptidase-like regulatory domain-containing protein [Methanocellales archaeon]
MIKKLFGLLWLTILISATSAIAIQIPYPIYGYIKDSDGKPAAGITVIVKEVVTGQTKLDVTDELGRYSVTLDNYRDGDEVQIIVGNIAVTRVIDVRSGGGEVDLSLSTVAQIGNSNFNYMMMETIAGLPNWILIALAILSSSLGFTARILKTYHFRADIQAEAQTKL